MIEERLRRLSYNDTGEIVGAFEDSYDIDDVVCWFNSQGDADQIGCILAAGPELLVAAEALLESAFAKNYLLISPFKELAAACAKARGQAE